MKKILYCTFLSLCSVAVGGCSLPGSSAGGGLFGDSVIRVGENAVRNPDAPVNKHAVSINLVPYRDARATPDPHKLGISTQLVIGMSGSALRVEPEVALIVSNSMRKRLEDAGFRIAAEEEAMYELSGVVRELSYDVRARDEINIVVESALKERASGKLVWSGIVKEKSDRFAGVAGNSKQDIANTLRAKVGVVAEKTTESISAILMASRPELFGLAPGTKPVAGVTVLHAASATAELNAGVLVITSTPARAKIYIDEVYYGLTPLRLELAAGVHEIRTELATYPAKTEKVAVRKGETTEMEIGLKR